MTSTSVSSIPAPGGSGSSEPVNAVWKRVDPSTVQLIANLFPVETCGRDFFARFVERASREPSVIPDAAEDTLYICTQSIATLGKELGLPNETAHKYVRLYMAIGLLRKQPFMGRLAFLLTIGIYHPPTTLESDLDLLIGKSRPKLRTMAAEVKARCKLYGVIAQDLVAALSHLNALLQPKGRSRHLLEQQVGQAQALTGTILASLLAGQISTRKEALLAPNLPLPTATADDHMHLRESESPQQVTMKRDRDKLRPPNLPKMTTESEAEDKARKPESTGVGSSDRFPERRAASNLPGMPSLIDSSLSQATHESPRNSQAGAFRQEDLSQNLPQSLHWVDSGTSQPGASSTQPILPSVFEAEDSASNLSYWPQQVDSGRPQTAEESPHVHTPGRFKGQNPVSPLPTPVHQVDSSASRSIKHAAESTQIDQKGRFGQESVASNPSGSIAQVDSGASANVNVDVITIINSITLNVKHVAAFCCNALDEPLSKQPIYLKLFRECEQDVRAISAALLFTLVHRRDGTMRNPASVFIARCRDYHAQGIPDEAADLVEQYGSLSYTQLVAALHKPVAAPPLRSAPPPTTGSSPPVTPLSLAPLPRWGTLPRLIQIESDRPGMSRQEALQVVRLAHGDRRTMMCRVDLERLSDGSYAVLLDNTITAIPRQTYFYSVEEWETRTAAIIDCFELFGVVRTGRRCLADMLKARRKATQ